MVMLISSKTVDLVGGAATLAYPDRSGSVVVRDACIPQMRMSFRDRCHQSPGLEDFDVRPGTFSRPRICRRLIACGSEGDSMGPIRPVPTSRSVADRLLTGSARRR